MTTTSEQREVVQRSAALDAAGSAPDLALDCFPDTEEHLLDPYHLHHERRYDLREGTVVASGFHAAAQDLTRYAIPLPP